MNFFQSVRVLETLDNPSAAVLPSAHIEPAFPGQNLQPLDILLRPDRFLPTLTLNHCVIENGYFMLWPGVDGVLFHADGRPLAETVNYCGADNLPPIERLVAGAHRLPYNDVLVCVDSVWRNWYHWLILSLSRIFIGQQFGAHTMLPDYAKWHDVGWPATFTHRSWSQSFAALQNTPSRRQPGAYTAPRIHTVLINNQEPALIACMPGFDAAFAPIRQSLPITAKPRRIFIVRRDTERLSTTEAIQLAAAADARGFVPVDLAEIDFKSQATLFANADAIIAAHGAGLANLVFCRPGTRVLEINRNLIGEPHLRPWFWLIAQRRGMRYRFLNASAEELTDANIARSLDWITDP